jgi:hypothetical protein
MRYETAGDPMTGLKWTRKTTEKLANELRRLGIEVSPNTVGRLLKKMRFCLRVNHKKIESGNKNPPSARERNQQFEYIKKLRKSAERDNKPIISVDTKKKEQIGKFKNLGQSWQRSALPVKDHDFPSDALGVAIPYGVYDIGNNMGSVFVGTSHDTPAFAVDAISAWWKKVGSKAYPSASEILILADSGGSNGYRSRVWKNRLQEKFCDAHGISVSVCHYPPGASKWNPIEHRLFSKISKNWRGIPLESYETALKYIRSTSTKTGLRVTSQFVTKNYETGERVSDSQMKEISLLRAKTFPDWNYKIVPSQIVK